MVRDVRYITLNCCYRDLQNVLMVGHLKTLALVESAGETERYTWRTWGPAQYEAPRRRVYLRRRSF